ncbi:MAG: signal peptidase I [Methanosarcinales archaeon]|nr:signal peptidase I [ANME-2 cluster archaeon]MDF1532150.1 signal peptidase I [ANME-2 cluster archaeon]MDW7775746.1 signal peptidase I [Methanosarcinales archaeon]
MNSHDRQTSIKKIFNIIEQFKTSNNFWIGLTRDLIFIAGMILLIMLVSQITLGTPRPAVAVESGSMLPNIGIGDVVLIQSIDRTEIISYTQGSLSGYKSFDNYGDVILYHKFGNTSYTPIIHRAMYWVDEGEPMWNGGPPAPHAGYITKGDNNRDIDQAASTSRLQPVKEEWIIGVARWHIPWVGYLSLAVH